jgi:hypothetical protein
MSDEVMVLAANNRYGEYKVKYQRLNPSSYLVFLFRGHQWEEIGMIRKTGSLSWMGTCSDGRAIYGPSRAMTTRRMASRHSHRRQRDA